jgi:hypothetical protein
MHLSMLSPRGEGPRERRGGDFDFKLLFCVKVAIPRDKIQKQTSPPWGFRDKSSWKSSAFEYNFIELLHANITHSLNKANCLEYT